MEGFIEQWIAVNGPSEGAISSKSMRVLMKRIQSPPFLSLSLLRKLVNHLVGMLNVPNDDIKEKELVLEMVHACMTAKISDARLVDFVNLCILLDYCCAV
jgi:hypothetical protein